MKIEKMAITMVVLIVLLHLVSCKGTQSNIIGKWQLADSTEAVEFFKDGTIKIVSDKGAIVPGKYTFVESDHVKVEVETPDKPMTVEWKVKISGDEIILSNELLIHIHNHLIESCRGIFS